MDKGGSMSQDELQLSMRQYARAAVLVRLHVRPALWT